MQNEYALDEIFYESECDSNDEQRETPKLKESNVLKPLNASEEINDFVDHLKLKHKFLTDYQNLILQY